MRPAYHHHCLGVLMDDLDLSNRGLARMVEPDDDGRMNALRQRIIAWRQNTRMTRESAERLLPALSQAAGRDISLEDLISLEDEPESDDARLARLEAQVAEVLALVQQIEHELHGSLQESQSGPT